MQTLNNDILEIQVSPHGAELSSIRKGATEYLWQGDPAFWGRRSPVLFPIVGSVFNGEFRVDGKVYPMSQHGFARDSDFELVESGEDFLKYRLESNEATLEKFPFRFCLEIGYRLHGNKVDVIWEVSNTDNKEIHFQIGAHPAFFYPDYNPETAERGYFTFEAEPETDYIRLAGKGCADADTRYPLPLEDGKLMLNTSTFDIDTFIVDRSQVRKVGLNRVDGTPWLALEFTSPLVGLWSPPRKNAPFVCIEPWYGRCDRDGFTGEFKDRDHVNHLQPGEKFSSVYTIEIF